MAETHERAILGDFRDDARQGRTAGGTGTGQPRSAPWPEPEPAMVRARHLPAPAFPTWLLGPFWSQWVIDAAESRGASVDYVAMPLLSAAGAVLANVRRGSPWAGWTEPAVVWTANVGNPSAGKSPALDAVVDLVRALEAELDHDFDDRRREHVVAKEMARARRAEWEARVAAAVKRNQPPPEPPREIEPPDPPARRRLFSSDPTTEKLGRLVAANARGFMLVRDELAGWLGTLDKYGGNGSDRAFYIESFGGRPYVIDRVKDGEPVRVPFLSVAVVGGIQPDRVASLLLKGDDDGLSARFLFAWPEAVKPRRPTRASDDRAALEALRWLLATAQEEVEGRMGPRVLPFDPAAADALQAWRERVAELEAGAAGLFLSWLGKLPGLAVRLALVLEFLWWAPHGMLEPEPRTIGKGAADAAIELLEGYAAPMARRVFGEAALPQADRDATTLARWLLAQKPRPGVVNARELRHRAALPTKEPERYGRALAELVEAGWLRPAPARAGATAGRQAKTYEVNPGLAEVWG